MTRKSLVMGIVFMLVLALTGLAPDVRADEGDSGYADKVKAAFIYKFIKYFQWPDQDPSDTFTIGVIGQSSIIKFLDAIAQKKKAKGRQIDIVTYEEVNSISDCRMLIVASPDVKVLNAVLEKIGDQSILTISDTDGHAEKGIAVNFTIRKGKVKFEINLEALKQAGISANAELLNLATIVEQK